MNTFPPEQRVRMLRPTSVLQTTNTFQKGLLDRYEQRPDSYGGLCLAGFAANFEFSKSRARTRQGASSDNKAEEENYILEVYFALRDVSGFIRERNRPSVIRYSPFNVNIDRYNYFRALVMLCSPWRDEQADLIKIHFEEFYQGNEEAIKANFDRFNSKEGLEDALRRVMEVEDNNEENIDEKTQLMRS